MTDRNSQHFGTANIVALAAIALIGVASFAYTWMSQNPSAAVDDARLVAVVHDADGNACELPLDEDTELTVETGEGTNTVVVRSGSVYVSEADCDNQDCIHQGKLSAPGRQIICLPHKLWIEVVSEGGTYGTMDVNAAAESDGGEAENGESAGEGAFDTVSR